MSEHFDRQRLRFRPLGERGNRVSVPRDLVDVELWADRLGADQCQLVTGIAEAIKCARAAGRPVILAFGAHAIKNGLGPVLIELMERGWVTHLATNGAGIIHDWEISHQGKTSEDVRAYQTQGSFGLWEETGRYLNLAILLGAYHGYGYGESIGRLIQDGTLEVPGRSLLEDVLRGGNDEPFWKRAAAADILDAVDRHGLENHSGPLTVDVPHPFAEYSVQAAAIRTGVPLTGHPMFGHDIIYMHPLSCGAAIGRTAETDFLRMAASVSQLSGGVYMSVGSAIMSPMVFEKSFSMAQNLAVQRSATISEFRVVVNDLHAADWNWTRDGEPPPESPVYYVRFLKSFARVCDDLSYLCADNRAFLSALLRALHSFDQGSQEGS